MMNRSQRRKVDRQIEKIMREDGDRCSVCRAPFTHNCRTFAGTTGDGAAALVGECCRLRLDTLCGGGFYVTKSYPFAEPSGKSIGSWDKVERAVDAHRQSVRTIDEFTAQVAKQAGVSRQTLPCWDNTAWKSEDAKWFKAHPQRAHRARPPFSGEFKTDPPPPQHEVFVVVRQIEPGMRIRIVFFRNTENPPFPDFEPFAHALFDLCSTKDEGEIKNEQLLELVARYDVRDGVKS